MSSFFLNSLILITFYFSLLTFFPCYSTHEIPAFAGMTVDLTSDFSYFGFAQQILLAISFHLLTFHLSTVKFPKYAFIFSKTTKNSQKRPKNTD